MYPSSHASTSALVRSCAVVPVAEVVGDAAVERTAAVGFVGASCVGDWALAGMVNAARVAIAHFIRRISGPQSVTIAERHPERARANHGGGNVAIHCIEEGEVHNASFVRDVV